MWYDVILDALWDTLKLFPFLLLLYILIELMEHKTRMGHPSRLLSGKAAPLIGAATGLVPMCGFSVMAAKLYAHRHLTLGTLVAVFVATSDEGLLVLLLSNAAWDLKLWSLLALLLSKFALGVGAGYLIDLFAAKKPLPIPEHHVHADHVHVHEESHTHVHVHEEEHDHVHELRSEDEKDAHHVGEAGEHAHEDGSCECAELSVCEHKHESNLTLFFLSPLLHALEVAGFVLLVNLLFGFAFFGLGGGNADADAEKLGAFMSGAGYWFQPLLCSAVGLIPNCASSVVLADVYALGGIGFGGLLGGLVANAGLGYLALFRGRESVKSALLILIGMFVFGVAVGYAGCAAVRAFSI